MAIGKPADGLSAYKYQGLESETNQIRLVHLLPGTFDEDLCVLLPTVTLQKTFTRRNTSSRSSLLDLQTTLPKDWAVVETREGRYLFYRRIDTTDPRLAFETSWIHPNPDVDQNCYAPRVIGVSPSELNYEALSYAWGTGDRTSTVHVHHPSSRNSATHDIAGNLRISNSLSLALRHLRHLNSPRLLWIDQLCIDQENVMERNQQLPLMADIYRLASRVMVWLGEGNSTTVAAIETLNHIGVQVEIAPETVLNAPGSTEPSWHHTATELPFDDEVYHSIESLLMSDYFSRVWIYQEVKLASLDSIFKCGTAEISLVILRRAIICLYHRRSLRSPRLRALASKCLRVLWPREPNLYERNLRDMIDNKCANPRDKVYGTLALAPYSITRLVEPQYSSPVEVVYQQHFLAYLKARRRLDLLLHCELFSRNIPGPSWIPDWSATRLWTPFEADNLCLASGMSLAAAHLDYPSVLTASGVYCGTVSAVDLTTGSSVHDCINVIRQWEIPQLKDDMYCTGQTTMQALASLLSLDRTRERYPDRIVNPTLEKRMHFWQRCLKLKSEEMDDDFLNTRVMTATMEQLVNKDSFTTMERLANKCFFTTDKAQMGLGPPGLQAGDHLFVLLGCSAPLVLRPVASTIPATTISTTLEPVPINNVQYHVVGKTWVHGLMYGEALLGSLPPNIALQMRRVDTGREYWTIHFQNTDTSEISQEDPRLGPLPEGWEALQGSSGSDHERTEDDPYFFTRFRDTRSGEIINADPRLLAEELRKKGVNLMDVQLV